MMDNNEKKQSFSEEEEKRMRARSAVRAREREEQQRKEAAKKDKHKKILNKSGTVIKIILIVVVIASLLFIAAGSLGNVTFTKIIDYVKDAFSNLQSGEGYPIDVGSGNVNDMFMLGETTVLLKKNEVTLLNKTAKETSAFAHSYSKPMAVTGAGRILLCDRVTGRYMIADRSEVLHTDELRAETFTCAVSKKGRYAFSVNNSSASSMVSVFDSDYDKLLDFKCADEYIIGLSFSPDSKKIAMIGIGSKNAKMYSVLYIMDIKNQEIVANFEFAEQSLNNVFYSSDETVIVVGENFCTVIEDNVVKEKKDFGYSTISRFDSDPGGNFAVVLSKYGSIDSGTVTLFDSTGSQIFSVDLPGKIECLDYDGKILCVVDSNYVVYTYNKKGVLIGQTKLESPVQDVAVSGKYCYSLSFGTVMQLDTDTDIDK